MPDPSSAIDERLAHLAVQAAPDWVPPDQLRRAATQRRRRRASLTTGLAAVMAAAIIVPLLVTGRGDSRAVGRPQAPITAQVVGRSGAAQELMAAAAPAPSNPGAVSSVAGTEQQFSMQLLAQLKPAAGENLAVSPASLAIALSMLDLGAKGRTAEQISALLGPTGSTPQSIASGWGALVADWATAAARDRFTLTTANSVWLQRGDPVEQRFMDDLARYFRAGLWQVDFGGNPVQAVAALNAWVATQTHGYIKELLEPGDVDGLLLVLVNAMYLNARWGVSFTGPDPNQFTLANGQTRSAPFISTTGPFESATTSDLVAAQVPYAGGRLAATMIMPKRGSVSDLVATLGQGSLKSVLSTLRPTAASLLIPTFRISSSLDLKPALQALGITDAFVSGQADLRPMSPMADYVSFVKQKVVMNVDEHGTTAAAATAIGVAATSASARPPTSVTFDHPFLFLIRDTTTGAVLFEAAVESPNQE